MDENKMLEQIKCAAEDVEIPEHLRPEAIDDIINTANKAKKVHRPIYQYGLAAAACLVVEMCIRDRAMGLPNMYRSARCWL